MANHKRRKPRTQVRCRLCTDARFGNSTEATGETRPHGKRGWLAEGQAELDERCAVCVHLGYRCQECCEAGADALGPLHGDGQ